MGRFQQNLPDSKQRPCEFLFSIFVYTKRIIIAIADYFKEHIQFVYMSVERRGVFCANCRLELCLAGLGGYTCVTWFVRRKN